MDNSPTSVKYFFHLHSCLGTYHNNSLPIAIMLIAQMEDHYIFVVQDDIVGKVTFSLIWLVHGHQMPWIACIPPTF
jgi:hypothetical protein